MNGAPRPPDADPAALRSSLSELRGVLDSVRQRMDILEHQALGSAAGERAAAPAEDAALSSVQEILSIPSAGLQPGELLTLAIDRVSRLLRADRAMLFTLETRGHRLLPRSAQGFRRDDLETIIIVPGEGIVGRAFSEQRLVVLDAEHRAAGDDSFIERFPVQEAIAAPVRVDEETAGVLYVGRRGHSIPFTSADTLLLLVSADRIAGALAREALLQRRAAQLTRLKELEDFTAGVLVGEDLAGILSRGGEIGCRLLGVRAAAVALRAAAPEASGAELEIQAARGLPAGVEARRVDAQQGLTGELHATDAPVACRDVQSRRRGEQSFLADGGFHACLLLPLRIRGCTEGVLYLLDTEERDFSVEEIHAGQVLASLIAVAVENARLYDSIEHALDRSSSRQQHVVLVERARTLGELAGGLAREFNSVFASILGKSQLLLARAPDEAFREGLAIIDEAAWHGADIVNRLAGLVPGAIGGPPGALDVPALAQDVVALARTRWQEEGDAQRRHIEVSLHLDPAPLVEASAPALREMVLTLVLNAVDAMPAGGQLLVATREQHGGAELIVQDTGDGIAEEDTTRIFDPFFTTRPGSRLGLGLTVAQTIVTRQGGRLDVFAAAGGGTRVVVWLPAIDSATIPAAPEAVGAHTHDVEDSGPADRAEPRPYAPAGPGPPPDEPVPPAAMEEAERAPSAPWPVHVEAPSILVLEDEEPVRAMLVDALGQAGYRVEAVADGQAGLLRLETTRFDLVLTDLALPQRSGLAVARFVKRASPQTPVVLITGWAHLLDPERLREHGVDLMLVKPFGLERVLSVVGDALRLRSTA